jgi:hypothetical protein
MHKLIAVAVFSLAAANQALACQPNGNDSTRVVRLELAAGCTIGSNPIDIKIGNEKNGFHKGTATIQPGGYWEVVLSARIRRKDTLTVGDDDGVYRVCCAGKGRQVPLAKGKQDCVAVFTIACDTPSWNLAVTSTPPKTFVFGRQHRDNFNEEICTRNDVPATRAKTGIDLRDAVIVGLRDETGKYVVRLPVTARDIDDRDGKRRYEKPEMEELMKKELEDLVIKSPHAKAIVSKRQTLLPDTVDMTKAQR